MIGLLARFSRASIFFKIVPGYFDKVERNSTVCIIRFDWLIALYLFTLLPRNTSFLIVKNCCVREELSDVVFFLQTQLQQINVQEHLFGEFALAPLTFGPCTSTNDNFSLHLPLFVYVHFYHPAPQMQPHLSCIQYTTHSTLDLHLR